MERKVKIEIYKMLIPIIGFWWVLKRILPHLGEITWWDVRPKKSIPLILGLFFYQISCFIAWKVFYTMYFFGYTFERALID